MPEVSTICQIDGIELSIMRGNIYIKYINYNQGNI